MSSSPEGSRPPVDHRGNEERYGQPHRYAFVLQPRLVKMHVGEDGDLVSAGAGGITGDQFAGSVNRVADESWWGGRLALAAELSQPPYTDRAAREIEAALSDAAAATPAMHVALSALVASVQALWEAEREAGTKRTKKARGALSAARGALLGEVVAAEKSLEAFAALGPAADPEVLAQGILDLARQANEAKQAELQRTLYAARKDYTSYAPPPFGKAPAHTDVRY